MSVHPTVRLACALLAICALSSTVAADTLAPFQETPVITGLTNPTAVRFAPDGRIFVAEQSGLLKVFNGLGDATPDILADLRPNVMNNWDRGFLGLAVDPQFPAAGHNHVYVLYTVDAPPGQSPPVWNDACADQTTLGCVTRGRLSRLTVAPDNSMVGPEHVMVDDRWCFQFVTHSIGDLRFGPEGALYLTGGEGASFTFIDHGQAGNPCNDPPNEGGALRSQDLLTPGDPQSWSGALMRLDVSGGTAEPWPTNPLVGTGTSDDDAILAHGLRNPFRFTIHPGPGPLAGEVWIGDVGEARWEEINRLPPPGGPIRNFGWPCYEGSSAISLPHPGYAGLGNPICQGLYGGTTPSLVTPSFYGYDHDLKVIPGEVCRASGGSVTGLAFYVNGTYPAEYQGALFFQDLTRECLWAILPDTPGGLPNPANRRAIIWNGEGATDLQVGPGGDLYFTEYGAGRVIRLQYFSTNTPPVAQLAAVPSSGSTPLVVSFDASGSSDADPGETLTYSWDLDGDGEFDDAPLADPRFAQATYTQAGTVAVSVRVTDSHLASASATQTVTVDNSAPVATILAPPDTLAWRVGDEVFFSGQGVDPDEGTLPASHLSWRTLLHHCTDAFECHVHVLQSYPRVTAGSLIAPDHPYPSYLELELTARDSGLAGWLDTAWTARRRVQFNNSTQLTDLVGFPVLVRLDATSIDYAKTENAGQDLRFTDPDGTLLPHQIETWDETGTSYVWVRVPQINAGSSADSIFMYYGNPTAPDAQNPTAVWDATYSAVYHMGATPTDSTSHSNDGVNHGTAPAAGQIGAARFFDGTTWVEVDSSPSLEISGTVTLEAWVKITNPALNDATRILDKKFDFDDPEGYELEYHPFSNFATALGSGGNWSRADGVNLDTNWHHLTATIEGITARLYVDGLDLTTDSSVSPVLGGPLPLNIGRNPQGSYFQGAIDELRISNVARSPDWVRAQYLSMSGQFTTIGAEEGSGGLTHTVSVSVYPETRDIAFSSTPPGLNLTVGGFSKTTPFNETVITNSVNSLSVMSPQQLGGVDQLFANWSTGGLQSHEVVATPALSSVAATFVSALCGDGNLDPGESCDDGNTAGGDCCNALCHFEPSGSTCSDGNACTENDTCSAGTCGGGGAVSCEDSNACTLDSCDVETGCAHVPAPDGQTCTDANECTADDQCAAGVCGGTAVTCNDANGCTVDSCDSVAGCLYDPAPLEGQTCTDSNACTSGETCTAGACGGSTPVSCEDSNACTGDTCDAQTGCVHDPAPFEGQTCSDSDACTSNDQCTAGVCVSGPPTVCDDANGCTTDSCDAQSGCAYAPVTDGETCSDSNACTVVDTCSAGVCGGGTPLDCDDHNPCTNDSCDIELGCVHTPVTDGQTCSDANACTADDQCTAGVCGGTAVTCNDANGCTVDSCDSQSGCVYDPAPLEGQTCTDANACTTGETCTAGACGGSVPVSCEDSNACTADTCDSLTGCVHDPAPFEGQTCTDANACTVGDQCTAGACVSGAPLVCDDLNACTLDSCSAASGCLYDPVPMEGQTCSDSNACTAGDQCAAGVCSGAPVPDSDVDGLCDSIDNCPFTANPEQSDVGGLTLLIPDGIGDVCQCGDLTLNGVVDEADLGAYRAFLADPDFAPLGPEALEKCSVTAGDPAVCDMVDVVVLQRALQLVTLPPGVAQACSAATD